MSKVEGFMDPKSMTYNKIKFIMPASVPFKRELKLKGKGRNTYCTIL